jgi:hypothetical protein
MIREAKAVESFAVKKDEFSSLSTLVVASFATVRTRRRACENPEV